MGALYFEKSKIYENLKIYFFETLHLRERSLDEKDNGYDHSFRIFSEITLQCNNELIEGYYQISTPNTPRAL